MSLRTNQIPSHKCQIDCTNHDEVINSLELKSKDLFFFWRNYEWLYNKYYNEVREIPKQPQPKTEIVEVIKYKQNHQKCNKAIEELEDVSQDLKRQNKKLRLDNESLKKQLIAAQNNQNDQDYQKQIQMMKKKCSEYEAIRDRLQGEISKLKSQVRQKQEDFDNEKVRLQRQNKKKTQQILELQQTIDQIRARPAPTIPSSSESTIEIQRKIHKQSAVISSKMQLISQQAERIVREQFQAGKRQIEQQIEAILSTFTQREINQLLVTVQEEDIE